MKAFLEVRHEDHSSPNLVNHTSRFEIVLMPESMMEAQQILNAQEVSPIKIYRRQLSNSLEFVIAWNWTKSCPTCNAESFRDDLDEDINLDAKS